MSSATRVGFVTRVESWEKWYSARRITNNGLHVCVRVKVEVEGRCALLPAVQASRHHDSNHLRQAGVGVPEYVQGVCAYLTIHERVARILRLLADALTALASLTVAGGVGVEVGVLLLLLVL